MNRNLFYSSIIMIIILSFILLAGCQGSSDNDIEHEMNTSAVETDEAIPAWQDVYGPSLMGDVFYQGQFPLPSEAILAEKEAFLSMRQREVEDFWKKNKELLTNLSTQFISLYEQQNKREYYYEIEEQNLIASFLVPDDDSNELSQRAILNNALQELSALPDIDLFERVFINSWSMKASFCEYSGALQLYDGVGCYISLAYLPEGEPVRNQPFLIQMLDEHWALMKFERQRTDMNFQILPHEKAKEVMRSSEAKQLTQQYHYWEQNRSLLESIAKGMFALRESNPKLRYKYDVSNNAFTATEKDGSIHDVPDQVDLWKQFTEFSATTDHLLFAEISIFDQYNTLNESICIFAGQDNYIEGYGYWFNLCYSPEAIPADKQFDSLIILDDHWFLMEESTPE